ncbi:hypothetical protein JHK85_017785 [Glycine max]|uniref:Uncharacterized protein n=2 Tax=Glycine subgen. Soja TaxID=1462606 RepID=A0A0R0J608_SOYBN|nr:hypothetical protein JHK85_017785 [Glycine max]KAH1085036.1 hypothetical protein GYH30_017188 [Glycine max]RZC01027.1 hypothetical protein D0Y65_016681 [Glycine soja]
MNMIAFLLSYNAGSCISIETLLFGVTSQSNGGSPLSTIHTQKAIGGVFVLSIFLAALLVLYGLVTFCEFKCEVGIAFSQFKPLHHSRHSTQSLLEGKCKSFWI